MEKSTVLTVLTFTHHETRYPIVLFKATRQRQQTGLGLVLALRIRGSIAAVDPYTIMLNTAKIKYKEPGAPGIKRHGKRSLQYTQTG